MSESRPMAMKPVPKKSIRTPAKKAAAAKRPNKKAAAPETITLRSVFEALAEGHQMPRKQAIGILAEMIETITNNLVKGNKIRISGLGILEVKNREARTGRNPATGESIQIPASKKIAFRAAKELKAAI
jgi:DNA-binding protein HU-beta